MTRSIPVTHSIPSTQSLLRDVLSSYDLGTFVECKLLYVGVNETYRARSADGTNYILRLYRAPWRSLEQVRFELDVLLHLERKGVPAAQPLRRRDGDLVGQVAAPEGTRQAVLFAFAQGKDWDYKEKPEEYSFRYGQAMARIHRATQDFCSPHQRDPLDLDFLFRDTIPPMQPYLAARPQDWEYLQGFGERLHRHMLQIPQGTLERGFVHGDLQGYHFYATPEGRMTFFDFDCCGMGYRAYDLAVFNWCSRLEEAPERWEPFLKGYRDVRPLSQGDEQSIPWFVAGRYLWNVWLHITNADDWGHGWLDDKYFDKLVRNLKAMDSEYFNKS